MRNMLIIAILGSLLISVGIYAFNRMFYRNYYLDIVLAENVTISSAWLEIESNGRISERKDRQFISLLLEPSFKLDPYAKAIVVPDGRKINPEIILVDADGNEHPLTYAKGRIGEAGEQASYGYRIDFPQKSSFLRVKLRSDIPIETKAILWSGYDPEDLP
ncbi:MAG: hypothetical protein C4287_23105 [Leptolyngbya sp. ERB_1_2]